MSKTYEEYEKEQLNKASVQSDAFAMERKTQADTAAATSNSLYDTAITSAEKNYTRSATDADKSYRAVYDANVVNELIARRHVEEAIANSNIANSGLNNTQQTAISLQRSRADADTTRQKQAIVDAIMRELDNVRAQYQSEKTTAEADIYAQADADILNFRNSADAAARQNAAALYTADKEALKKQTELWTDYQKSIDDLGGIYANDSYSASNETRNNLDLKSDLYTNVNRKEFTGTTYDEAVNYIIENGGTNHMVDRLMTYGVWITAKARYEGSGRGSAEVSENDTYEDYLKTMIEYMFSDVYDG